MRLSLTHDLIGKSGRPDAEKRCVISQRMIHFTVGDTPCHHNIGCRMRLREHVFDLFTGPDIPVRHVICRHCLFPLRLQPFSLPHALHDLEGKRRIKPHMDQVDHNIITTADRRRDRCLSLLDQRLGISQPYIRPVSQSGDPDQIRKMLWFGI